MNFTKNWFKLLHYENINKNNKNFGGIDITYKINEKDFLNRYLSTLNNYILDEKMFLLFNVVQLWQEF